MYQHDKDIMKCLLEYVIYNLEYLAVLNIANCEKLKKMQSLADILHCDGKSIKPKILTDRISFSTLTFLLERLRNKDLMLWKQAMRYCIQIDWSIPPDASKKSNDSILYLEQTNELVILGLPMTIQRKGFDAVRV